MRLAILAALPLLFILHTPATAAPKITVQVAFPSGTHITLVVTGNPLQGSGAMTYGKSVRYPMAVTSGSISGHYLTLEGTVTGSKVTVPSKLVINLTNGNAWWVTNNSGGTLGKASVTITR